MRSTGRPRTTPVLLKDGYYIEVCDKGTKKGMKIRSESKQEMENAANQYAKYKKVIVLGEYKDGLPRTEPSLS
jgi:hypothetical protein